MGRDLSVDRKRNLTLVVTHQCNFDCRYCLQKHEDVYMPRETAVKAIDMLVDGLSKIKENPRAQISFYGGEPLLARNEIEYLVTYAVEKLSKIPDLKYAFEITTNGTLLDQEFIDFAKKNHNNLKIKGILIMRLQTILVFASWYRHKAFCRTRAL